MPKIYDVSAIGLSSVNHIVLVEESFLVQMSLNKGEINFIDHKRDSLFKKMFKNKLLSFGDTASNILTELAKLGAKTYLISQVGDDILGKKYVADLQNRAVKFDAQSFCDSNSKTFQNWTFITPDAVNTNASSLHNLVKIKMSDEDEKIIAQSKYLIIEANLFDLPRGKKIIERVAKLAKENQTKIVFTTCNEKCAAKNAEKLMDFISEYVDVVFASLKEMMILYDTIEIPKILEHIMKAKWEEKIVSVAMGQQGLVLINHKKHYKIPYPHVTKIVDKNGAASAYAGGIIYGLLNNQAMVEAANVASNQAVKRMETYGGRPNF